MKIPKSSIFSIIGALLVIASSFNSVLADPAKVERDLPGVLSAASQDYFKEVIAANKEAWVSRPGQKVKGLHMVTTVCVTVDENGVGTYYIHESSGDENFDQIALDVCKSTKLNKPPETWNPRTKIGVVFSSRVENQNIPKKFRDKDFVDTVQTASSLRWAATRLPGRFAGDELNAVITATFDKDGKQTFQLTQKSTDEVYDKFVMDTFKDTFIPAPPAYWDNNSSIEIKFDSKNAGISVK